MTGVCSNPCHSVPHWTPSGNKMSKTAHASSFTYLLAFSSHSPVSLTASYCNTVKLSFLQLSKIKNRRLYLSLSQHTVHHRCGITSNMPTPHPYPPLSSLFFWQSLSVLPIWTSLVSLVQHRVTTIYPNQPPSHPLLNSMFRHSSFIDSISSVYL